MDHINTIKEEIREGKVSHTRDLLVALSSREKENCIQFGKWGLPVKIVSKGDSLTYNFAHRDLYFRGNEGLTDFVQEKTQHLSYSNKHHIRSRKIKVNKESINFETEWVEYAWYLGTNSQLMKPFRDKGTTLREYLTIDAEKEVCPSQLGNELAAVATFIIEEGAERYLLLTRRGKKLHTYPNCMSTSTSGAMGGQEKWLDFRQVDETLIPCPKLTIIREAFEELGLEIREEQLTIDALSLQVFDMQLNFLLTGVLHINRSAVKEAMLGADDRYEIEGAEPIFVPFTVKDLVPYLLFLEWSPTSAASVLITLEKYFGREVIEDEITKLLEN